MSGFESPVVFRNLSVCHFVTERSQTVLRTRHSYICAKFIQNISPPPFPVAGLMVNFQQLSKLTASTVIRISALYRLRRRLDTFYWQCTTRAFLKRNILVRAMILFIHTLALYKSFTYLLTYYLCKKTAQFTQENLSG